MIVALPEDPAQRHRVVAGAFTDLVLSADPRSWDASSPVAGWTARDVVRHLTDWLPALLASSAGIDLTRGPSVDEDPAAAWTTQTSHVAAVSSSGLLIFSGLVPGDGLVVGSAGLEAAVQDAGEAVGELSESSLVAQAAGALLVVVGAGSG